jgi:AraC-like DNA-binding protein
LAKVVPKYTIEQINQCDQHITMNIDIKRLEDHLKRSKNVKFPHRHEFYNLIYITHGSGTHDIDFKRFKVQPNQLFFMNDGQIHNWDLSDDIKGYTFFFKKQFYTVSEPHFALNNLPFFHNGVNEAQMVVFEKPDALIIENLFQDMLLEQNGSKIFNESIIITLLKIILIRSLRAYVPDYSKNTSNQNKLKIRQFEQLIEENFLNIKAVKDYAELITMSSNYLNGLCTQNLGKNAGELIRERVILEAKRLLIYTNLSICELSNTLGYENCSYFIRLFKKTVGQTPEQFRHNFV